MAGLAAGRIIVRYMTAGTSVAYAGFVAVGVVVRCLAAGCALPRFADLVAIFIIVDGLHAG